MREDMLQMPERLNACRHFNSEPFRIAVYFAYLLRRVASAHVAECGFSGKLIHIFRVKHQEIESRQCGFQEYAFDEIHCVDPVSGTVQHDAERCEAEFPGGFSAGHRTAQSTQESWTGTGGNHSLRS